MKRWAVCFTWEWLGFKKLITFFLITHRERGYRKNCHPYDDVCLDTSPASNFIWCNQRMLLDVHSWKHKKGCCCCVEDFIQLLNWPSDFHSSGHITTLFLNHIIPNWRFHSQSVQTRSVLLLDWRFKNIDTIRSKKEFKNFQMKSKENE